MVCVKQAEVAEWSFTSDKQYADRFNDVRLDVIFTGPDGDLNVPAFWAGSDVWRVRFSAIACGDYRYRTVCSDEGNSSLHDVQHDFRVVPYNGTNPLYLHGPLEVAPEQRRLRHIDGTPFFWLADTWWMGLCERLDWPTFQSLASDRAEKGYNVVQIVAGLYPDMPPFDERGASEAGFPWEADFAAIRPAFFDDLDRRIEYLVGLGIVPCVVGCWGYYLDFMGEQKVQEHWRYLIARYGAFPVVWCLAGEATMPYYLSADFQRRDQYEPEAQARWTRVGRYVRDLDPFRRPLTLHNVIYQHDTLDDPAITDFIMLQTGHGSHQGLHSAVKCLREALDAHYPKPVLNGEACYEGICEGNREDVQRFVFWASVLSGAAGHTYGADGVWQVNRKDAPYGPSPLGSAWGEITFEDACRLPGCRQLGLAKKLLERYPWWKLEPHQEWLELGANAEIYNEEVKPYHVPYAAGIPGKLRIIYLTVWAAELRKIRLIEPGVLYGASLFNPSSGSMTNLGPVKPDEDGTWPIPTLPVYRDWVLIMEAV